MTKPDPRHMINETRDWARIVLAACVGVAIVILAARGDLSAAMIASAASLVR